MHFIGIEKHILQVHGFISAVEKISQIAEFPAGESVDEENVGPVVGDGDFEIPFVVGLENLPLIRLQSNLIIEDAFFFRAVHKAKFGSEAYIGDFDIDGIGDFAVAK